MDEAPVCVPPVNLADHTRGESLGLLFLPYIRRIAYVVDVCQHLARQGNKTVRRSIGSRTHG